MSAHGVRAMSLLPGDVVHISPHTVTGRQVNCPDANVALLGVHFGDDTHREVVLDYGPWLTFEGKVDRSAGSVVYGRVAEVQLLWHGVLGGAA
jgi:hypothetical protein